MKIAKLFVITASAYFLCACRLSTNTEIISETLEGKFRANMELNDSTSLPFILSLTKHNSIQQATIYNSEETIVSDEVSITADSLIITLPVFGSKLAFNILNNNTLTGEFTSLNRPKDYKINLSAKKQGKRFDAVSDEFKGRYKITFGNDSTDLAIGLFESSNGIVKATFATETGDYRFIEGVVKNGKLTMSCFDGAHYFYFDADVKGDSLLNGNFYSGNHYHTTWEGVVNNNFELRSATKLTSPLDENAIINKTIGGIQIPDPNAKITAIQILGTWCPNCMDESRYYASTLFPKYKNKGLAIVGLAFEYKGSDSLIESRISRFKNDLGIQYPIVKAGNASKTEASDLFPQLSKIISFPSTIFLNQKGEILRVHTGFYGPGTGKYFEEYVKETEAFLNSEL
tara:strand:+ start:84670 stop:85872 length:1203 start_codon:yes stop_codon:yes gene_type:complete